MMKKETTFLGIPCLSSGYDLVFTLLWAWVWSLMGELRSHKLHCMAKQKIKQ